MTPDAQQEFKGREKTRFPSLLLVGAVLFAAILIAAIIAGGDFWIAVIVLAVVCAVAAIGYRVIAGSNRSDADASDNVPKQPARAGRPLGDTPEAHDEVNPHDLPLDNPGRHVVEDEAGGAERTTRGTSGDSVAH
jgi:flagellar basal body-associated protein FliL